MATQITADLPTLDFPREVDYPTQEDWAAFSAAAELNFGILGGDWSTQMQLWKTQANAMSNELNTNATIAQGLADYQGDWISQGYTLGQTVSVSGIYYICKLTHSTGQNPTDDGSIYWNLALGNWSLKVDTNMSGYTSKTTPVDTDLLPLSDSSSSFGIKKLSWTNLKATLKTYFDSLYLIASSETVSGIIEIATTAEAQAGTDDLRAVTPLKLRAAFNAAGAAPMYASRAWVSFNGTGTVVVRESGNISSIIDNGTGDYTINFITAMTDVNYSVSQFGLGGSGITSTRDLRQRSNTGLSTTSIRVHCQTSSEALSDIEYGLLTIFR